MNIVVRRKNLVLDRYVRRDRHGRAVGWIYDSVVADADKDQGFLHFHFRGALPAITCQADIEQVLATLSGIPGPRVSRSRQIPLAWAKELLHRELVAMLAEHLQGG